MLQCARHDDKRSLQIIIILLVMRRPRASRHGLSEAVVLEVDLSDAFLEFIPHSPYLLALQCAMPVLASEEEWFGTGLRDSASGAYMA